MKRESMQLTKESALEGGSGMARLEAKRMRERL